MASLAVILQSFEREPEVADTGSVMQHGPLPPFGNLFGMTTYVDIGTGFEGTSGAVDVAFSAGERKCRHLCFFACCWASFLGCQGAAHDSFLETLMFSVQVLKILY
jgi:hypothetical protein